MLVLGIDAAWTATQPSGVALISKGEGRWRLLAVAPSYADFNATSKPGLRAKPAGSVPNAAELLASAESSAGKPVDLIAVDMPLSHQPITSRRASDHSISLAYGGRWCSTHTPNSQRPGAISDILTTGFKSAGYPLQTKNVSRKSLIEVYPHPALVELARADRRLPYKASKVRSYWPTLTVLDRKRRLLSVWSEIVLLLQEKIDNVASSLPSIGTDATGAEMKAYEDMLDAIVCAWVGAEAMSGRAVPFGDEHSAIWVPSRHE